LACLKAREKFNRLKKLSSYSTVNFEKIRLSLAVILTLSLSKGKNPKLSITRACRTLFQPELEPRETTQTTLSKATESIAFTPQ
jgi:hypothetical protein